MAGNTFGEAFRVTIWGESHGTAIGVVIDGCPAGLSIDQADIDYEMARRRPGQGGALSSRKESDKVEILSGVFIPHGEEMPKTTGTPISLAIYNKDAHSKSYDTLRDIFRPGHGDKTYLAKYGIRDHRVGGRHDISAIPRIIPVCEAMVRLTLADYLLRDRAIKERIGM